MAAELNSVRFECPAERRFWLLCRAFECAPLNEAIELARAAEAFVTMTGIKTPQSETAEPAKEPFTEPAPISATIPPSHSEAASPKRTSIGLSSEQREELLQQLARGARNSELAQAFGLSRQQIQGIRMGSAREIAVRRGRLDSTDKRPNEAAQLEPATDEIIRYLRQQDDVVVPDGNGQFLVNGRFRLGAEELVIRANRIRRRQGKPEFAVAGVKPSEHAKFPSSRHPMFQDQQVTLAADVGSRSVS